MHIEIGAYSTHIYEKSQNKGKTIYNYINVLKCVLEWDKCS